ncbi:MAG: type II toxin-antitoxin system VapC family toxin [Desulfovibrionales bacterium]|nr:type II toxin-antitoxin system VapC family toxin [Desulfovibrionales bacterium]
MRLLLDTHIALWAVTNHPKLPLLAKQMILDTDNQIFVSAASVWEIAIKHSINSQNMPLSGHSSRKIFSKSGYSILSISGEHAAKVETLEWHHKDPFDRLLIAQSLCESLQLLTNDHILKRYTSSVISV